MCSHQIHRGLVEFTSVPKICVLWNLREVVEKQSWSTWCLLALWTHIPLGCVTCDVSLCFTDRCLLSIFNNFFAFFLFDYHFFALSSHLAKHYHQSQIHLSDEESWVTHPHLDTMSSFYNMSFLLPIFVSLRIV